MGSTTKEKPMRRTCLHVEVNPKARYLFRKYAQANDLTMTDLIHEFLCQTIGRADLPSPSKRGRADVA